MWNTTILPIMTSLTATGLGIFFVWLFNRKRQSDERANQMSHIMNEISDIRNKIAIGLERSALETAKNEKLWEDVKEDIQKIKEQVSENKALIHKTNVQVSENKALIQKLDKQVSENKALIHIINEQVSENKTLIQKLDIQVSENTNSIENLIIIVKDLQSVTAGMQNIMRDSISSKS